MRQFFSLIIENVGLKRPNFKKYAIEKNEDTRAIIHYHEILLVFIKMQSQKEYGLYLNFKNALSKEILQPLSICLDLKTKHVPEKSLVITIAIKYQKII